jgi:hypothetical protein
VGEAHLDNERLESINSVYKRQLQVHFSWDPSTPNANGFAIHTNMKPMWKLPDGDVKIT